MLCCGPPHSVHTIYTIASTHNDEILPATQAFLHPCTNGVLLAGGQSKRGTTQCPEDRLKAVFLFVGWLGKCVSLSPEFFRVFFNDYFNRTKTKKYELCLSRLSRRCNRIRFVDDSYWIKDFGGMISLTCVTINVTKAKHVNEMTISPPRDATLNVFKSLPKSS